MGRYPSHIKFQISLVSPVIKTNSRDGTSLPLLKPPMPEFQCERWMLRMAQRQDMRRGCEGVATLGLSQQLTRQLTAFSPCLSAPTNDSGVTPSSSSILKDQKNSTGPLWSPHSTAGCQWHLTCSPDSILSLWKRRLLGTRLQGSWQGPAQPVVWSLGWEQPGLCPSH